MSGIEIAGLVLSAIPLLISALEHYSDGVQTIRKIRHSSKGFLRLKRVLETENDIFLNSIELLLKDDVDDHVLATMLQYPGNKGVGWNDAKLDARLRARLGRSYSVYFEAVDALAKDIKTFADAIQLNDSGKAPFTLDAWSVKDALSRIRFGLKMKGYNDIVNDITAQNQRIMWLTQQSNLLEPLRKRRRKLPDFDTARAHAQAVFEAIKNVLPNTCIVGHQVSLHVKPSNMEKQPIAAEPATFRLVVHHKATRTAQARPTWTSEETELQPFDTVDSVNATSGAVRFQDQVQTGNKAKVATNNMLLPANEIRDLCWRLQSWKSPLREPGAYIGYLRDDLRTCRHGLFWPKDPLLQPNSACRLSLASIISDRSKHRLSLSQRRTLAFALADSMLQLCHTPWLGAQWGKNEITLFEDSGAVDAVHLFVSADVSAPINGSMYFQKCHSIREDTLFALGIMLIELALEKGFEDLQIPDDIRHGVELSSFTAAARLVDEVYHVAGTRYGDVVRRCIWCDFDHRTVSLQDPTFRGKVFQGVVAELEQEVSSLTTL